jgi:phosphate transport system substrate-binding protein
MVRTRKVASAVALVALLGLGMVVSGCGKNETAPVKPAAGTPSKASSAAAPAAETTKIITGAGATFPYPIYSKWNDAYNKVTGVKMNYQSIGSGGGIAQITAKTVDFGASDKPLTPEELDKVGLLQFPTVMGGVVPVVNLPGVTPNQMRLTHDLLANIYLHNVTKWNDPAVKKANPDMDLPDLDIQVVHRSDGSGTTWIFTNYLSKVSSTWKSQVGNDTSVGWPCGVGGKGNEGVAALVQQTKGAIGYVEYAYCLETKMTSTMLANSTGAFVTPTAEAFQAAAANADWAGAPGFYMVLTDQPGAQSWPIAGATFILVYKQQDNPATCHEVLKFFDWAYSKGDSMAEALYYIPMPDSVVKLIEQKWASDIHGTDGQTVWPK